MILLVVLRSRWGSAEGRFMSALLRLTARSAVCPMAQPVYCAYACALSCAYVRLSLAKVIGCLLHPLFAVAKVRGLSPRHTPLGIM